MSSLVFIDGNDLRAAELAQIIPDLAVKVEALQSGFSTSAPEPGQRARDKVLAHPVAAGCFAEAVDLTTMEGKSLRLELDSEDENRFCKRARLRNGVLGPHIDGFAEAQHGRGYIRPSLP